MKDRKTNAVIWVLVSIIVILVLVLLYAFVLRPSVTNYIYGQQVDAYNYGQTELLNTILTSIQQYGYVEIPVGNQSIYLAPVTAQAAS